jgi:cytidylate kinase
MASSAAFTVTDPQAPRRAVAQNVAEIAAQVAVSAAANTPQRTGRMARSWRTVPGRDPGTALVVNDTEYARFVEYGTRHMRAAAPLGRATAGLR